MHAMNGRIEGDRSSRARAALNKFIRKYSIYIIFAIIVLISSILSSSFFTLENISNLLRRQSYVLIISIGMLLVIIGGGIDLSVGAVLGFAVMATAGLISKHYSYMVIVLAIVAIGLAGGLVQGVLISYLNLPAFIITLAFMSVFRGFSFIYSKGQPIYINPESVSPVFQALGTGSIAQIPYVLIIAVIIAGAAGLYLRYTVYGRSLIAVGGNSEASWFSGINPKRYRLLTYIVSSALAAISGYLLCARLGMGHPDIGSGYELDAVAAVVLGGASLNGGRGSVLGTIVGVITLGLIGNILNLLNIPSYPQQAIKGAIIIIAVFGQLGQTENSRQG